MTGDPWLAIKRYLDTEPDADELLWDGEVFRFGYATQDGVQEIYSWSSTVPVQFATLEAVAEWCAGRSWP